MQKFHMPFFTDKANVKLDHKLTFVSFTAFEIWVWKKHDTSMTYEHDQTR